MNLEDPFALPQASPFYGAEHRQFQAAVRRFTEREIVPFLDDWEEAGRIPRTLHEKAAAAGLLGLGYPQEYGGTPADSFFSLILNQEMARAGAGGLAAALFSHGIALPPILAAGSQALKRRIIPDVLAGRKIAALAVTEPDAGSDVAAIRTRAVRDGDHYVITGTKTTITSGMRADVLTVAVRTGGEGHQGISLIVVETPVQGLERHELPKMGWWCSDTATLHFDGVRVPAANLVGVENGGFLPLMMNFNRERLGLSALAIGLAKRALADALAHARQRLTFGRPLASRQVIRHKLVEMAARIRCAESLAESLAWRIDRGEEPVADICLLKIAAADMLDHVARAAVQILGGAGFIRGHAVERIYREAPIYGIGGGASEILADLAARRMGI